MTSTRSFASHRLPRLAATRSLRPRAARGLALFACFVCLAAASFAPGLIAQPYGPGVRNPGGPPSANLEDRRPDILADLEFEPIRFDPPEVASERLPESGALLLAARDDSLPFLTISLQFPGGYSAEPIEHAGRLSALMDLLQTGGAGGLSGEERSAALGRLGARLEFSAGDESWSVSLRVLKEDYATGRRMLEEALLAPKLPADKLAVIQNGMQSAIRDRNDNPDRVARRKLEELMYPGMRRGYSLQSRDVEALNVAALQDELQRRLRRDGLIIAVSGDTEGLNIPASLDELAAKLPSKGAALAHAGPDRRELSERKALERYRGKIVLVETQAAQTAVMLGAFLPAHNHPDFYAFQTANYVLGGGSFNSRLMREVRVQRGLAYYAYSYPAFDAASGQFVSASGTRSAAAHETLALMLEVIGGMRSVSSGASEQEIALARDSITGGIAFQFASPEDVVANEVRYRLHDMPADYLRTFPDRIRSVDRAEAAAVMARYLQNDQLFIVLAGPAELKARLEDIRPVVVVQPEEALY